MTTTLEQTETAPHTFQTVEIDSTAGRKFLRKIIRDNDTADWSDRWIARASVQTDWRLEFDRTIRGEVGEPDTIIVVRTDVHVRIHGNRGTAVKSFHDAEPVMLPEPARLTITSGLNDLAWLLSQPGCSISIHVSAGSTHSSHYGLGFYALTVRTKNLTGVEIGETITKDGRTICAGPVDVH